MDPRNLIKFSQKIDHRKGAFTSALCELIKNYKYCKNDADQVQNDVNPIKTDQPVIRAGLSPANSLCICPLVLYSPILETFYLNKTRTNLQINQHNLMLCQRSLRFSLCKLFSLRNYQLSSLFNLQCKCKLHQNNNWLLDRVVFNLLVTNTISALVQI
jgi:hypothetical protein